jgi:hypothetical protein
MTAIVSAYTPEGFVLAADGLRLDFHDALVGDRAIKIFSIKTPILNTAYACAGAVKMFQKTEVIDTAGIIRDCVERAKQNSYQSFSEFVTALQGRLNKSFLQVWFITIKILIVGYRNDGAWRAQLKAAPSDNFRTVFELCELCEAPVDFNIFNGSPKMFAQIESDICEPETLEDAASLVRKYIELCALNRYTEPECNAIGGHIHIAATSPQSFYWMIPPADESNSSIAHSF